MGGSGKVIASGPEDHVFFFYSDRGGPGILGMSVSRSPATNLQGEGRRSLSSDNIRLRPSHALGACHGEERSVQSSHLNILVSSAIFFLI